MRVGVVGLALLLTCACGWQPGDVAAFKQQNVEAFEALPARAGFEIVAMTEKADADPAGRIALCGARTYSVKPKVIVPAATDIEPGWRLLSSAEISLPVCATAAMRAYLEEARSVPNAVVFVHEARTGGGTAASSIDRVNIYTYMLLDQQTHMLYTSFLMVDPTT